MKNKRRRPSLRDEHYVISLCDSVLGKKSHVQKRFSFLRGDAVRGRAGRMLPVDAYYSDLNLAIEYHERQHTESVSLFDKRMTISGVPRWKQRLIYDERRRDVLPKHGICLVVLDFKEFSHKRNKRLSRDRKLDLKVIKKRLGRSAV